MTGPASEEALAGARAYEALHVPALFQEWVEPVLDAAHLQPGEAVLDVACGTDVLARGARRRVGSSGSVIGVDPDAGMLGVARQIDSSVDWRSDLRGWLPVMGVHLQEATIERILDAADRKMANFISEGEVVFDSPAHVISGSRSRD